MRSNRICLMVLSLMVFALSIDSYAGEKAKSGNAPAGMVEIPGGTYYAGLKGEPGNPARTLEIGVFSIDKYEVTQEAFKKVMGSNPSHFKGRNLPVESVTWHQADEYCKKVGKRLPTEWEWEKSAKSGTKTAFYWGDNAANAHRYAWNYENSDERTHPVGQKAPNGFGLYDMAGNVWEWTSSEYDNSGNLKVFRGGSWVTYPESAHSAERSGYGSSLLDNGGGFRCAM